MFLDCDISSNALVSHSFYTPTRAAICFAWQQSVLPCGVSCVFSGFFRYVGEGSASNMAVVHVKMVSGWIPEKDSLKSLLKDVRVGLRRYDIDADSGVQLYFNEVSCRMCMLLT